MAAARLTHEEAFHFDSFGWILLPRLFQSGEVSEMRRFATRWLGAALLDPPAAAADELPAPLEPYSGPLPNSMGGEASGARVIRGLYNTHYGHPYFEACATHPEILRVVSALQEGDPTHVNQNLMQVEAGTDERITFHGNLDPGDRFYEVRGGGPTDDLNTAGASSNGRYCFSSLVNVSVSLVDVPAGQGFLSIPGSHKRGFTPPLSLNTGENGSAGAYSVDINAGDALVFCEALIHSTGKWRRPDAPRLTVFSRFWAHCSDERHRSYGIDKLAAHNHRLSRTMRDLQRPSRQRQQQRRQNDGQNDGQNGALVPPSALRRLEAVSQHTVTAEPRERLLYTCTLTEPAGISRYLYPVSVQLTRVAGIGTSSSSLHRLRVRDVATGKEVAAQVDSAADSDTVLIDFHCSMEPFETRQFVIWASQLGTCAAPELTLNGLALTVESVDGGFVPT
jgi:hypothetical protein